MKNLSIVLVALLVITFTHACSDNSGQVEVTSTEEMTTDTTWTESEVSDTTMSDSTAVVEETADVAGN
jgi:cell division protein FtsL